jgi:muramoyltetrapeptide carboxypeptidase
MKSLGLRVKWSGNLSREYGYLAGKDRRRLKDLHAMFRDPEVQAVWCIRGGYGSGRLLPSLDYDLIRRHPKILVGYSDITALLNAVRRETGLVCFHGPVSSSEFSDYTLGQVRNMLFEPAAGRVIRPAESDGSDHPSHVPFSIRKGKAEGILVGGNLSLVAALCGTPFQPDVEDKILFLEDVGEKPYRIDRMLTQLRQSLPLEKAAGVMLGKFAGCEPGADDRSLSLAETLEDRLRDLKIPVGYGFPFGHIRDQCTLPVGAQVRIDTRHMTVEILEPVVSS